MAVGSSSTPRTILTSTNGFDWQLLESSEQRGLSDIGYGNGRFVAVGENNRSANRPGIVSSTDGLKWTPVDLVLENALFLQAICFGNGRFIAVGVGFDAEGMTPAMISSSDGMNWNYRQLEFPNNGLDDVTYGQDRFVAVGGGGAFFDFSSTTSTIVTSTDGINWTSQESGATSWLKNVAYGNGRFVATGSHGALLSSTDGVKWRRHNLDALNLGSRPWANALSFCNGYFVAAGSLGGIIQSGNIINLSLAPAADGGQLKLSLAGSKGLEYGIEASTNLVQWRNLTNISSTQPTNLVFEALPVPGPVFFRAVAR
ncbi:MAG: hypothetical protein AB1813_25315 [Verrucomicrobiota bacterium]